MSDEYSIDAKYKRDNLIDEHYRYERALEEIRDAAMEHIEDDSLGAIWVARIANDALRGS